MFVPRFGVAAAHVLSTLLLSVAVIAVTFAAIGWIATSRSAAVWTIGGYWLMLTLAFEFLRGHYLFRRPWHVLRADYHLQDGRIWLLVLVSTFAAPAIAARLRGL